MEHLTGANDLGISGSASHSAKVAQVKGVELPGNGRRLAFVHQQAGVDVVGLAGVVKAVAGVARLS